jgi:hypothetical protein
MWRCSRIARGVAALVSAALIGAPALAAGSGAPTLISFSSPSADGTYREGHVIAVQANFSEALAATSSMTVRLDTGASVTLNHVASTTLSGRYVVGGDDYSDDLEVALITGASVRDLSGNRFLPGNVPSANISTESDIKVRGADAPPGGSGSSGGGSSGSGGSSSGGSSGGGDEGEDDDGNSGAAVAVGVAAAAAIAAAVAMDTTDTVARVDQPFGGIILTVITCENGPLYLLIYDYRTFVSLPILLQPWSRLNMYYAPMYGNAVLGTYMPIPGECVLSYYPYVSLQAIGEVSSYPYPGMGTSLGPPVT